MQVEGQCYGVFEGQVHASCVARDGEGVLLLGPSGAGKSDLALRLLRAGCRLVADDRVEIAAGWAAAPVALAGLLEVRGLGILRLPYLARARLVLAVDLGGIGARLPAGDAMEGSLPLLRLDAAGASAPDRVLMALDCASGRVAQVAGLFASDSRP